MKDGRNNWQICRQENRGSIVYDFDVKKWQQTKGLDLSWSSPFSSALFPLHSLSLSLSRLVDFAMLWSSCASRPSGYLDIAWSQSPVNQISSDLVGPADKTLHGKRKWQTAGDTRPDYEGSVKRDWSQRLFKLKKAAKNENILPLTFPFSNLHWLNLIWTSLASACLSVKRKKIPTRCYKFSLTKGWMNREHFQEWIMLCRILYCPRTHKAKVIRQWLKFCHFSSNISENDKKSINYES